MFSPRQVDCVILRWKDILVKGSAKRKGKIRRNKIEIKKTRKNKIKEKYGKKRIKDKRVPAVPG